MASTLESPEMSGDSGLGRSQLSNSEDDSCEGDTGEQQSSEALFRSQVLSENNRFVRQMQGYIDWLISDQSNHVWPGNYKKSKNVYRRQARKFEYDEKDGVLFKVTKDADGIIGELFLFCHSTVSIHQN